MTRWEYLRYLRDPTIKKSSRTWAVATVYHKSKPARLVGFLQAILEAYGRLSEKSWGIGPV